MIQRITAIGAVALLLAGSGCQTYDTFTDPDYAGSRVYSGTRRDLQFAGTGLLSLSMFMMGLGIVDLPFSLVADTLLLPVTVPNAAEASRLKQERERVDVEVASPVKVEPGEAPEETARRLFQILQTRTEKLNPSVTDCYSIHARIELKRADTGPRSLTGAEFKPLIRSTIQRMRRKGDFMTYRDVHYEVAGNAVRITAQRATAFSADRVAVQFLVGPGDDGQWRILEETSPGWF